LVTFDQFNASLLNNVLHFLKKTNKKKHSDSKLLNGTMLLYCHHVFQMRTANYINHIDTPEIYTAVFPK